MTLRIAPDGIIYDDETQDAVGFLGATKPHPNIAWGSPALLQEALAAVQAGRVVIQHERRISDRRRS